MRLNLQDIEALIVSEQYHRFPNTCVTVCLLTLSNGYTVIGDSNPSKPDEFNEAVGRDKARQNARNKIWPLQSYALRNNPSK